MIHKITGSILECTRRNLTIIIMQIFWWARHESKNGSILALMSGPPENLHYYYGHPEMAEENTGMEV